MPFGPTNAYLSRELLKKEALAFKVGGICLSKCARRSSHTESANVGGNSSPQAQKSPSFQGGLVKR
jgi:hypothetical protein